MIYNHGDAIIHREILFECFINSIKLRFNYEILYERLEKAADVLHIKIQDTDNASLSLIIQSKAETNMRNIGYLLGFNDVELNHIYKRYCYVGCELSDSELEEFIEYYYNIPKEVLQEEITADDAEVAKYEELING